MSDVQSWIKDVNPNFDLYNYSSPYNSNCGSCALAVFSRLNGSSVSTASPKTLSIDEMNHATGLTQTSMSPQQIEQVIKSSGPGAHAVVGIDRYNGPGHWFNVFTPDGENVYTIDGQTGEISGWPPNYGNVSAWDISM